MHSKDWIIEKIAEKACNKITIKVIRYLQKMTDCLLSGDDTPLKNVWDEICVQVQDEESFFGDAYIDTISSLISKEINYLDEEIKQAIWFQTDEGLYWDEDEDEDQREPYFDDNEILRHILSNYIIPSADNWTNLRIKKYLERSCDFD